MGPTAEEREPPPVMTMLRRSIDALCANRNDVVVKHYFDVDGAFGLESKSGAAVYGWGTSLSPIEQGSPLWIWFDGFDRDLALMLRDTYWFEWGDLDDEAAVISDVVGLCAGVLTGDAWEWRTRRRRGCDVFLPDGRVLTATDGRLRGLRWGADHGVRSQHQLPAYGRGADPSSLST